MTNRNDKCDADLDAEMFYGQKDPDNNASPKVPTASEFCAKLISHTTSQHNVRLVQELISAVRDDVINLHNISFKSSMSEIEARGETIEKLKSRIAELEGKQP